MNEKELFFKAYGELCKEVSDAEYVTGRRPFPLQDMVFALGYKT